MTKQQCNTCRYSYTEIHGINKNEKKCFLNSKYYNKNEECDWYAPKSSYHQYIREKEYLI